jgi:hypothetical protein
MDFSHAGIGEFPYEGVEPIMHQGSTAVLFVSAQVGPSGIQILWRLRHNTASARKRDSSDTYGGARSRYLSELAGLRVTRNSSHCNLTLSFYKTN